MLNVKIGLMLIASSAIIGVPLARAEYPQYVEIVKAKQSSPCQCVSEPNQLSSDRITTDNAFALNDAFILNDDKIGDRAIAKFGCDCAAHRRTVASEMRSAAQLLIKQIN